MYLDSKAILDSLTRSDVTKIIMALGSDFPTQDNKGNLIFQTVCHCGKSHKLYYYHEPSENHKGKILHCYTDCGESFSIIECVIRSKRAQGVPITWYKALHWIGQITGKLIENDPEKIEKDNSIIDDFTWINKLKNAKNKRKNAIPELKEINENILDIFAPYPHEEFLNAGISIEAMNRFEIGYYSYADQITIPQRDLNQRLLGVRVRNLTFENEDTPKYCPAVIEGKSLSHSTGSVLYGAWVTKDRIKESGKVLIAEAEKSCLLAYTYFGEDSYCVATTGSAITLTQQKILLKELGVREIIYMPDRDYKGTHDSFEAQAWFEKQVKKVKPFVQFCKVYIIVDAFDIVPYKDNALDCGLETFLKLYDAKVEITMSNYLEG